MARYVTSVPTRLSADAAFAYMSDMEHFSEWDPGITRVRRVAGQGVSIGTAWDVTVKTVSTTVMRYVVRECESPRRILLVSRTPFVTSVDEITVAPTETGSVVTYEAILTLNGPLRVFDRLLGRAFRIIGDRGAAGLRRVLGAKGAA
jgi:hypothetical protein